MWNRTISYQGLRLLFFVSIVAGHCGQTICGGGGELCSFFFIISGFLYKYNPNYWQYLKNKILKIFPIYYICMILLLLGKTYTGHLHIGWDIIPHLLLIQSWLPQFVDSGVYYIGPAWFISSLFFCYLLSPFCYKFVMSRNKPVIILLLGVLIVSNHMAGGGYFTYYSPIERLFEYILGMAVGLIMKNKESRKEPFPVFVLSIVLIYLLLIKYSSWNWLFIFIHPIVIALIWLYESDIMNIIFGNKLVIKLASAGMFIYLSHNVIKMAIPGDWYVKTIVCVIIGYILSETYNFLFKKRIYR